MIPRKIWPPYIFIQRGSAPTLIVKVMGDKFQGLRLGPSCLRPHEDRKIGVVTKPSLAPHAVKSVYGHRIVEKETAAFFVRLHNA